MAERINISEIGLVESAKPATRKSKGEKETLSKDILKRFTFYLEPRQNLALEELRLKLKRDNIHRDKSDLVREAIDEYLKKNKV